MKTNSGARPRLHWVVAASMVVLAASSVPAQEEKPPTATFGAKSLIRSTEALLPLMDYVPLFSFNMSYPKNTPAPRILSSLYFWVTSDLIDDPDNRPYSVARGPGGWARGPNVVDLLDFAIFRDNPVGTTYDTLGIEDYILGKFDNTGSPLGTVNRDETNWRDYPLYYELDNLVENNVYCQASGVEGGANYIVAVRTSALWHSSLTMGTAIGYAYMYNPSGPTGEDSYPNDFWSEPVFEKTGYSSSFTVYDYTSGPDYASSTKWANAWNYPIKSYTPLTEHVRPRWDLPAATFEVVFGESFGMRRLFAVETWIPLLGINAHSTTVLHEVDSLRSALPDGWSDNTIASEENSPALREVNVVLTDFGGKTGALAGSGGFDPRKHLDPLTGFGYTIGGVGDPNKAYGVDYAYNGLWVFHDTNGNGVFDPPVPDPNGGAQLTDHPLIPDYLSDLGTPGLDDRYKDRWQYIDNPPDGGDPWWRVKLRFLGGRRRGSGDAAPTGHLEPTPDTESDFFVVSRADSGFQDASLVPGDGTGYLMGADFKANIEPRWFDPVQGHWQGGIHINTQISGAGTILGDRVLTAWQDDSRWLSDEPWWPQRTSNSTTTKPVRGGHEIHDYTLLYESNSRFRTDTTDLTYPFYIDSWVDPLDTVRSHFHYGGSEFSGWFSTGADSPVVNAWYIPDRQAITFNGVSLTTDGFTAFTYPFETAPFYKVGMDDSINGPRSPMYLFPPAQPGLPSFSTWPKMLAPGRYPSYGDWDAPFRKARLLKQHVEIESVPVPMLGINLVGAGDPVVNRVNARVLNEIVVAFWGPEFTKSDLKPLDKAGLGALDKTSGVQLRYDKDGNGTYTNPLGVAGITTDTDPPIELKELAWSETAEHVDLDGDKLADDLDGDGVVTDKDVAWVLRLIPLSTPLFPTSDQESFTTDTGGGDTGGDGGDDGIFEKSAAATPAVELTSRGSALVDLSRPGALDAAHAASAGRPVKAGSEGAGNELTVEAAAPVQASGQEAGSAAKATAPAKALPFVGNPGDDLFITVRTSATLGRFERFRAFIPAYLPDRPRLQQLAGIKSTPTVQISPQSLEKGSPDEGTVQDFFYHDMLEANVPVILHNLVGVGQTIPAESPALAAIGIDISTNRSPADSVADEGASGTGAEGTFTVGGKNWAPNAFTGYFLIDKLYKAFDIVANSDTQLTLLGSAAPASGQWFIAKDPTFLEQVIVEFYDEGADGDFDILDDLLPLDRTDLANSGVAIYRDNDNDPSNVNGEFDPADLPVALDADPQLVGEAGEVSTQVKFVFSSPGTDDVPKPRGDQEHLIQWVPDTFAADADGDPNQGDDFFVVVRTSENIVKDDDFSMGLVSWGPDTPTQPDADTFVRENVPDIHKDGLSQFLEYPWGSRALGFITHFKTAPDTSGFNWIRSTVAQNIHTRVMKASSTGSGTVGSTVITSVTPAAISTTPAEGTPLTVTGKGFGSAQWPLLKLGTLNAAVKIYSASDTRIDAKFLSGAVFPKGPVMVYVQNTVTRVSASRSDLLVAVAGVVPEGPIINSVSPETGVETDFPVSIRGSFFVKPEVFFGTRQMPVSYVDPLGTRIDVNFPSPYGLDTGALDVVVKCNHTTVNGEKVVLSVTKTKGFYFKNNPGPAPVTPCFIATAAYGTPFGPHLDAFRSFRDGVLLKTAAGTAFVDLYYSMSPSVAKVVAVHPWLAGLVRIVLTPVAWLIEWPVGLIVPVAALWLCAMGRRRRRVKAA